MKKNKKLGFIGRQLRHIAEGKFYFGMIAYSITAIGVFRDIVELPIWAVPVVGIGIAIFGSWTTGVISMIIGLKGARREAQQLDNPYFVKLRDSIEDIKKRLDRIENEVSEIERERSD